MDLIMDTCVYKIINVTNHKKGVVVELKANQNYFKPKLKRGEAIIIDDYHGNRVETRIKAIVIMDELDDGCDVEVLLPPEIHIDQVKVDADLRKVSDC